MGQWACWVAVGVGTMYTFVGRKVGFWNRCTTLKSLCWCKIGAAREHWSDSWRRLVLLESNTLWASGHVEWQFRRKLFSKIFWKSRIFGWKNQFVLARTNFPTLSDIIAWHMQNLSSIHRLSEKFEWAQGFGSWGWSFENDEISLKRDVSGRKMTLQNSKSLCWCKIGAARDHWSDS